MIVSTLFVTVCFAGITTMAASVLDKPYYDIEDAENLFKNFLKEYKKTYSGKEYKERLEIFEASIMDINQRNAMFPGTVFKVNHFADLRPDERAEYRGFTPLNATRVKVTIPDSPVAVPDELDWRKKGLVTHVKDQKKCSCSFIFSAIGNIEGQYAATFNLSIVFSEQQALDCLPHGSCSGGRSAEIMKDFTRAEGLVKGQKYPYEGVKSACRVKEKDIIAVVSGVHIFNIPDEDVLKKKLVEFGPLAVSLAADDFDHYNKGILEPRDCIGKVHNHEVLLVGYGAENGTMFWILKNSWGEKWGEAGYVRLRRGVNACVMGTSYTATAIVG